MNKNIIFVKSNGNIIKTSPGVLASEIIHMEKPCGGHGKCGKCKIIAKGEISPISEIEKLLLTESEINNNIRLSCVTTIEGYCEIQTINYNNNSRIVTEGFIPTFNLEPSFKKYGVAIDIGTTTLAAQLYDISGNMLAKSSATNPQTEYGADVISRIESALSGKADILTISIRNALDELILTLAETAKINSKQIDGISITGNTVMLYLLVGESVKPLSMAPFKANRLFNEHLTAQDISLSNLSPNTDIYIPPCISAFVGADIVCDLVTLQLSKYEPLLLADIGTNGEIALWDGCNFSVCSTAAGPAFEGAGISSGMRGMAGAIDKVSILDDKLCIHTIDNKIARGICGSGLIDAIACMLELDILDESGFLHQDPFVLSDNITLTQKDIRMVQLTKSAIRAGVETIYKSSNIPDNVNCTFAIAGGFSSFMDINNAQKIGLLPSIKNTRVKILGNASLSGATMLLLNKSAYNKAIKIANNAHTLDLSTNQTFKELYMENMFF